MTGAMLAGVAVLGLSVAACDSKTDDAADKTDADKPVKTPG